MKSPNGDGDPTNDDTDEDGTPNYLDPDDDGDGVETKDEDTNGDGDLTNDDDDGDGIPNYLDDDASSGGGLFVAGGQSACATGGASPSWLWLIAIGLVFGRRRKRRN